MSRGIARRRPGRRPHARDARVAAAARVARCVRSGAAVPRRGAGRGRSRGRRCTGTGAAAHRRCAARPRGRGIARAGAAAGQDPLHRPQLPRPCRGAERRTAQAPAAVQQVHDVRAAAGRPDPHPARQYADRLRGRTRRRDRPPCFARRRSRRAAARARLLLLPRRVGARLPVRRWPVAARQVVRHVRAVRTVRRDRRRDRRPARAAHPHARQWPHAAGQQHEPAGVHDPAAHCVDQRRHHARTGRRDRDRHTAGRRLLPQAADLARARRRSGDVCEVEIDGLGVLRNPVVAADTADAAR